MVVNPFESGINIVNDMDDFKMPYRLVSRTDLEIMTRKYQELSNRGYGLIVRLRSQW